MLEYFAQVTGDSPFSVYDIVHGKEGIQAGPKEIGIPGPHKKVVSVNFLYNCRLNFAVVAESERCYLHVGILLCSKTDQ